MYGKQKDEEKRAERKLKNKNEGKITKPFNNYNFFLHIYHMYCSLID